MKVDRKARARININTAGDNTIISAPGEGKYIAIDHLHFISSGGTNAIILKDGSDIIADYDFDDNQAFAFDNTNPDLNTLQMSTNSAFIINISNSLKVTGFVLYRIVGE